MHQGRHGVCQRRRTPLFERAPSKALEKRLRESREAALAHANRGRPSHRRLPERTRLAVLRLARTKYAGFNDHHLCEKLL